MKEVLALLAIVSLIGCKVEVEGIKINDKPLIIHLSDTIISKPSKPSKRNCVLKEYGYDKSERHWKYFWICPETGIKYQLPDYYYFTEVKVENGRLRCKGKHSDWGSC